MRCVAAPPSDQNWNEYVFLPCVWGDGALSVFVDPMITVRVNDAMDEAPFTTSMRPPGIVWKVSTTVWGSSRMLVVLVRPPESVAVSLSSR